MDAIFVMAIIFNLIVAAVEKKITCPVIVPPAEVYDLKNNLSPSSLTSFVESNDAPEVIPICKTFWLEEDAPVAETSKTERQLAFPEIDHVPVVTVVLVAMLANVWAFTNAVVAIFVELSVVAGVGAFV